ncbi:HlyD family secretion protein [Vibrio hippocampi]|uniref:p-hydroxybenzoic acid efflux pump subunit AaeA n=1 Tax=Vibrio hippocampi TaxID=654686 RepID=A0ABN8DLY2_9VIBR|nr:HlyD family secretion protein [Vibrio hippocampi]CAH0529803.1 p-hydroxybenzoic acid efflux pump subunit AaeA [Vibrio hippocampi]
MNSKIYKYSLNAVLVTAVGFSAFLISSDNVAPFTTQATVHNMIASVAPQVSGVVSQVNVKNGDFVNVGDVLFKVDGSSYSILADKAEAELTRASELDKAAVQSIMSAERTIELRKVALSNATSDYHRVQKLHSRKLATTKELDDSNLALASAKSGLDIAIAEYNQLKSTSHGKDLNSDIKVAMANLETAQLNLERTSVTAASSGYITNLQLHRGTYVSNGEHSLYLVDKSESWISADFNEKGIDKLSVGTEVRIVFDAKPGFVFTGYITSQDAAVYDQYNPSNQIATVSNDNHWIREQQKVRTRIHVINGNDTLIGGSRATVMVEAGNQFVDRIGAVWMQMVSLFRYIY